ncbi:TPA: helix-turn-helix transcriptional regulator [Listeria monocytogenes]|uniref:XRE family transcriptional regulator n=1 Tax=Listeria monocytogenes TaxID=1639 RepID=A0A9P2ECJ9_LISMN|nr:helix-turn-helix transcriptional regulator [Listeria monocytogenes]EAC8114329.1 XRE family transcriptional regulator [Listeria monocytogenes]EAD9485843.1 XRE family transcriptional regulator [Listeria monocytogenes]EAE4625778.1 XRE family transcriptional regulator [Listeria monocytogenes]EAE9673889.1 XRE family transcriptional regulator [Listeria monocytogenes]EAG6991722.1 XRE family transcriptional regulator [Listeria monocytogenes]
MHIEIDLKYIREKRESLGFSQKDMAIKLGFKNASTYLKYETGEYKIKAEMLPLLAKILKCNISNFFTKNVAKTETKKLTKTGG